MGAEDLSGTDRPTNSKSKSNSGRKATSTVSKQSSEQDVAEGETRKLSSPKVTKSARCTERSKTFGRKSAAVVRRQKIVKQTIAKHSKAKSKQKVTRSESKSKLKSLVGKVVSKKSKWKEQIVTPLNPKESMETGQGSRLKKSKRSG